MTVSLTKPTVGGSDGVWGPLLNSALDALAAEINGHETAADPHGDRAYANTQLAFAPAFAIAVGSVYPARASITTNGTQPVIWVGPDSTKVTIGTGYAITEVDFFWGTT